MLGIAYIRQLLNLSLIEFADKMNVSNQMVSMWERGLKPIAKKRLDDLSKEFNIPQEYFQKDISEIDKLIIQKIKLRNDYEEVEGKSLSKEMMYALQANSVYTKKELLLQDIGGSIIPIGETEEYVYKNQSILLGHIKMYSHMTEIITSGLVPIEVIRSTLMAILHSYGLKEEFYYGFESDEEILLTREVSNSIDKLKERFDDDLDKIYL